MADTYDPSRVIATFGNKDISSGIAEGTFISVTKTNERRSLRGGSDGEQTIQVNPNRSVTVEITYRMSSATNDTLEDLREVEDADPAQFPVGTFKLEYIEGGTIIADDEAFITGPPDQDFGLDEPSRIWRLMLPHPQMVARGNEIAPRIGAA